MQKNEINIIVKKVNKKDQMKEFLESELFLTQFPESQKNLLLKTRTLGDFKKILRQSLNFLAKKRSFSIVFEIDNFFTIDASIEKTKLEPPTTKRFDDDYSSLKNDLFKFSQNFDFKREMIADIGWREFCLNQGITCEIVINNIIKEVFEIKSFEKKHYSPPSINILNSIDNFFEKLNSYEIICIMVGNAIWNVMIDYFQNKTRYSILPDNGKLLIETIYECILIVIGRIDISIPIKSPFELGNLYFAISEYEECENIIIEPWRLLF